jgi:cytochrome c2
LLADGGAPVPGCRVDWESTEGRDYDCVLGCGSCHTIPGIAGAHARVGPSLASFGTHFYVAGVLSNQPGNLTHWIEHPQSIHPQTVMPELGVDASDAADMAAYLYSLN